MHVLFESWRQRAIVDEIRWVSGVRRDIGREQEGFVDLNRGEINKGEYEFVWSIWVEFSRELWLNRKQGVLAHFRACRVIWKNGSTDGT